MHGGRALSNRYYPFLSYIVASTRSRTASKKTSGFRRFLGWFFGLSAAALLCGVFLCVFVFSLIYRQLPPIDTLTDYRPKVPLRVWSADGKLIGEFGEERRDFVHLKDIPEHVKFAILAAEDDGFYEHHGVEITGILRAAVMNVLLGRRAQGGSTITQQVARNFFLTTDRTYTRKLYEIAMSFKIEQELTKDEILEIYLNQIYLGQRAYGFSSAARTYFGRPLSEISIGEAATLAGLPVAPSAYNPIVNPSRATMRKNYVLRRMYDLGYIDEVTYLAEKAQPMQTRRVASAEETLRDNVTSDRVSAKYAAELARMLVYDIFKDETYSRGLNVYTTIRSDDQQAAVNAVRRHLINYDRKYGYRGPEGFVELGDAASRPKAIKAALAKTASSPFMVPAVVTEASPKVLKAAISADEIVTLDAASLKFGRRHLAAKPKKGIDPCARARSSACSAPPTASTGPSRRFRRWRPPSWPRTSTPAPSRRSWAGSTSTSTCSTTSRRPGVNRGPRSSPSSIRRRSTRASRRAPSSTTRRFRSIRSSRATSSGSPRTTTGASTVR